ncbi:MAG: sugar transferase [Lachnospiraceae bacterium]|nr:sugar transferase [Lachnospiraceae bacterium]
MYKRSIKSWVKHLDFFLLDLLCLQIALILGTLIRNGQFNYTNEVYLKCATIFAAADIIAVFAFSTFKRVLKRGFYKEAMITVRQALTVLVLATFYMFVTKSAHTFSRAVVLYTCAFYLVISYMVRVCYKQILLKLIQGTKSFVRKVLVISESEEVAVSVINKLKKDMLENFEIVGVALLDTDKVGSKLLDTQVVADLDNIAEYACREWVDEAFISMTIDDNRRDELVNQFVEMGMTAHLILMEHEDFEANRNVIEKLAGYTVLTSSIRTISMSEAFLKRFIDIIGGIVGCILTAIMFIFIAPAIYIKSPGPIFFSQIRVGRNGKKFKIYKFRSMYLDAEERKKELMEKNKISGGLMFKMDQDPRIIGNDNCDGKGIGNFIRNTSLDEFPQFLNVLKGDMSLVGTRPPTLDEWEKYELHHRARLAIKPGITGLWQVSGRSNITDFEEVVKLDRKYISEWSFGQDIKILIKTVLVVLRRDGSM